MIEKNQILGIAAFVVIFGAAAIYQKCKSNVVDLVQPPAPPGKVETTKKITKKTTKIDGKTGDTTIVMDIVEDKVLVAHQAPKPKWRVSIGTWVDPLDIKRDKIYDFTLSKRISGDFWGDVALSSDKKVKFGFSMEF